MERSVGEVKEISQYYYYESSWQRRFLSNCIYALCTPLGKCINHFIFRLQILGKNNLMPLKGQGFISVSNHVLYNDPLIVSDALFPRRALFTMHLAHLKIPLVGRFLRLMGAFPLPPKAVKKIDKSIQAALLDGWIVHFFPEGRLMHCNQTVQRFRDGAFFYAVQNQVPVLVITTKLQLRNFRGKPCHWLPPKVQMIISEPIFPPAWRDLPAESAQIKFLTKYCYEQMQKELEKPVSPPRPLGCE